MSEHALRAAKCKYGHIHYTAEQKESNVCGAYAIASAIREYETDHTFGDPGYLMALKGWGSKVFVGGSKNASGKFLEELVKAVPGGFELERVEKKSIGEAARSRKNDSIPLIVPAEAVIQGGEEPQAHWVMLSKRNKDFLCDRFCVVDSASGKVWDIQIGKEGFGTFSFIGNGKLVKMNLNNTSGCYALVKTG